MEDELFLKEFLINVEIPNLKNLDLDFSYNDINDISLEKFSN